MPSETILDMVFTGLVGGALGALLWARMNRIEAGQDAIKADIARIWERMATREDVDRVRGEMGGMREEMAVMRSDLTHVALAVGANRPKPAEGETSAN